MGEQQPGESLDKKRILQPTFHFATTYMKIGEDYTTDKIPVTEFVEAGQLLASFVNFPRMAARGFSKAPLEAGEYARLTEDGDGIVSTVAGYPKVEKLRRKDMPGETIVISIEPLLKVSPDWMRASIAIHPPLEAGRTLKDEDLHALIAHQRIIFGLDNDAIEEAKEFIRSGGKEFKLITIARGRQVGKSSDAYLRYDLEIGPIAGKMLDDGSIDFRERRIMVGVKAGQCIATKIPSTQGESGVNVYGEETPAPAGKDIKIELLNDVRFSRATNQVIASRDGVLSIVNDRVIKVCAHQTIRGDIDYKTGNVESMNCVTVNGNIQPGFKVTAAGDVVVSGEVMSARILAQGNIVVKGGITGKSSYLEASGDADINFIEQGVLKSGGIVVVRKQVYYSEMTSRGDICCHQSSKVIGGRIVAEGNVILGDVGSENSRPALIAAGVVADRIIHFESLKAKVVEQQDAIIQWLQMYHGSSTSKKVKNMEKELAETKLQLMRVNMIPGTELYSRAGGPETEPLSAKQLQAQTGEGFSSDKIKIDVKGTIFAMTRIHIGNCSMILEKTVDNRTFKLHPNGKRIIVIPNKR